MAGTSRAIATSVLGLVALQAVSTSGGSGRITELFRDVNALVDRLLDPNVPAIPNLAAGDTWGGTRYTPSAANRAAWGAGSAAPGPAAGLGAAVGAVAGGIPVPATPRPFSLNPFS